MSNITVLEMVDEILKIEKEAIRRRRDVVSTNTMKYGKNKADADVVTKIINILNERGVGDDN